jgi:hypothetical protein
MTLLGLTLALAGCGGERLTTDEQFRVSNAEIHALSNQLDDSHYGDVLRDVDWLIGLYRSKPDAKFRGRTVRQVLGDIASDLKGSHPDLADRIDRALRT